MNPQILTAIATTTAANTYTSGQIILPVPRNRVNGDKVTVIELLKLYWNLGEPDANPAAAGSVITSLAQLSTAVLTAHSPQEPRVISAVEKIIRGAFTAAGTYGTSYFDPLTIDLTDGQGHGIIVATDFLFLAVTSTGFVGNNSAVIKMLYRFKDVNLAEYIGIVQSQQ